jgi:NADH-quinone oxidoreductase subunit J
MMGLLAQQAGGAQAAGSAAVGPVLFYLFGGLTVFSAWMIVFSRNIVRMSVFLLFTLGGSAGLYFLLASEFLAAIQLIVYAGGTLILIVFGVMLTSRGDMLKLTPKPWEAMAALGIGTGLMILMGYALAHTTLPPRSALPGSGNDPTALGASQVQSIAHALLGRYMLPFELAAVLLLVVMIAAAFMARKRSP